jgi:hypothetical protein
MTEEQPALSCGNTGESYRGPEVALHLGRPVQVPNINNFTAGHPGFLRSRRACCWASGLSACAIGSHCSFLKKVSSRVQNTGLQDVRPAAYAAGARTFARRKIWLALHEYHRSACSRRPTGSIHSDVHSSFKHGLYWHDSSSILDVAMAACILFVNLAVIQHVH